MEIVGASIGVCCAYVFPEDFSVNTLLILIYRSRRIFEYASAIGLAVLASYAILGARW
jgi:hypothetical protein